MKMEEGEIHYDFWGRREICTVSAVMFVANHHPMESCDYFCILDK
jgi:hypothetical protein